MTQAENRPVARRRRYGVLAVAVAAAVSLACWWLWLRPLPALYVAVAPVRLGQGLPEELGTSLRLRLDAELSGMRNIHTIRFADIDTVANDPLAIARAVGADEVVSLRVEPAGKGLLVEIHRSGKPRGESCTFESPEEPGMLLETAAAELGRLFSDRVQLFQEPPPGDYLALSRIWPLVSGPRPDYRAAVEALRALRESGRAPAEAYAWEASLCRYLTQNTGQKEYLERAREVLEDAPDDDFVLLARIEVAQLAGDHDRAVELLRRAEQEAADHPYIWFYRARLIEDESVENAIAIVAEARESFLSLRELARLERKAGLFEDSRRHSEKALQLAPDDLVIRKNIADLELMTGKPKTAEKLFLDLLEIEPEDNTHLVNLATTDVLLGKYNQAVVQYEQALRNGHRTPALLFNLAEAYHLLGNEQAKQRYVEFLESTGASKDRLVIACRAQAFAATGDSEAARDLLGDLKLNDETSPEVLLVAAVASSLLGERKRSEELAQLSARYGMNEAWFGLPWFEGTEVVTFANGVASAMVEIEEGAGIIRDIEADEVVRCYCNLAYIMMMKRAFAKAARAIEAAILESVKAAEQARNRALGLGIMLGFSFAVIIVLAAKGLTWRRESIRTGIRLAATERSANELESRAEDLATALSSLREQVQAREAAAAEQSKAHFVNLAGLMVTEMSASLSDLARTLEHCRDIAEVASEETQLYEQARLQFDTAERLIAVIEELTEEFRGALGPETSASGPESAT
jgi:tetratricopeptide (TPR) repeat protein